MKKIALLLSAALLLAASCTKSELNPAATFDGNGEYLTFTASILDGAKTVTTIDRSGLEPVSVTSWEVGDVVKITCNEQVYNYVATTAGVSTTLEPATEEDRIPATETVSLTAVYGSDTFAEQNISVGGVNDCKAPLTASVEDLPFTDGKVNLEFEQAGSILEFAFAAESIALKTLILKSSELKGINKEITVTFEEPLDLSTGTATVQVVIGGELNASGASQGLPLEGILDDDSHVARAIWINSDKSFPVGSHIYQPLGKWIPDTRGISSAKDLRELSILISKGWTARKFVADDGKIHLLNDIDISDYTGWSAIGPNGGKDIASETSDNNMLKYDFDGENHTISGFSQDVKHSSTSVYYGLFGVVNANISNLKLEGKIVVNSSGGSSRDLYCGGIAAVLMPGKTITGCTTDVEISVQSFPRDGNGTSMGDADASKRDFQRVGGIVGECRGNVIDCVNNGDVRFDSGHSRSAIKGIVCQHFGGIVGHICNYGDSNVTISGCTNNGLVKSEKSVAGYCPAESEDFVSEVQGFNAGGVIGTAGHMVTRQMTAQTGTVTVSGCSSTVFPILRQALGGNVGGVIGRTGCDKGITVDNCFVDITSDDYSDCTSESSNKNNWEGLKSQWKFNGKLSLPYLRVGGVIGSCHHTSGAVTNCTTRKANLSIAADCSGTTGGVIGYIDSDCHSVTFSDLSSTSDVNVKYRRDMSGKTSNDNQGSMGGVVGVVMGQHATQKINLKNISSSATVGCTGEKNVIAHNLRIGGLVGVFQGAILDESTFEGTVTVTNGSGKDSRIGGLIGSTYWGISNDDDIPLNQTTLKNCSFSGNLFYDANQGKYRGAAFGYAWIISAENCQISGKFGDESTSMNINADNVSLYAVNDILTYVDEGGLYTGKLSVGKLDEEDLEGNDITTFNQFRARCGNTPFEFSFVGGGGD